MSRITVAATTMAILAAVSGSAQTTTIGNTVGGSDSWNNASNWDSGIPSGAVNAVVAAGIAAGVDNASTPSYSGTLTLNNNAALTLGGTAGSERALQGPSSITLLAGSTVTLNINITFPQISLTGNGTIGSSGGNGGHHRTYDFNGAITGAGGLTLTGNNNATHKLNASNNFSGGLTAAVGAGDWRVYAKTSGALGTGDVTINSGVTLQVDAPNVMATNATLALNGSHDYRMASKLILNADDTIGAFVIDGVDQSYGTKNSSTHPGIITGNGSLFIAIPPGDDDGDGEPNETDPDPTDPTVYPGAPEICDGKDNDGNGIVDDGLGGCTNTMAASGEYVLGANWSLNTMPTGEHEAHLADGVAASAAVNPVFTYTGSLHLGVGSSLTLQTLDRNNALGTNVIMAEESMISIPQASGAGPTTFPSMELLGSARISAGGHHFAHSFNGVISGSGSLIFTGANNATFDINRANTFTGGVLIYNGNSRIDANVDGALGEGHVVISNACSLRIASSLSDTINDDAILALYGPRDTKLSTMKLHLDSDETVGVFQVEGEPQAVGTWGAPASGADFESNLISGGGILTVRWTEIPAAGMVLIIL